MKKLPILAIVFSLLIFPFSAQAESDYFKDVSGSYARFEINQLAEAGMISGYLDGTFKPTNNLTRAQFAKMLALALNLELAPEDSTFTDVAEWAKPFVGALVNAGITKGITPTKYGSNNFITREQMTVMYVRAMGVEEMVNEMQLTPTFIDSGSIGAHARSAVAFAQKIGFVNGSHNYFKPRDLAKREAAARLLYEFALQFDHYFEPFYITIFEGYGFEDIASVAYIEEDHSVKIYFLDGSFLFYDIEMDDFFMYEMFEVTGDDWLGLTEEEKESLLFDLIDHWADLNEIDIQYGGINVWDLRVMLNEYYQNGGDPQYDVYDDVALICIEEGFFTWVE